LRLALGTTQPSLLSLDARILFLGLKWTVCKFDCSSSSNAKVKNEWSSTSLSLTCPHGLHRDVFYLYRTDIMLFITVKHNNEINYLDYRISLLYICFAQNKCVMTSCNRGN
jgi:hypothetical protein